MLSNIYLSLMCQDYCTDSSLLSTFLMTLNLALILCGSYCA